MPQYAEDLVAYTEKLGDGEPQEDLQEPDFKKRALSREAPAFLVYKVASAIENIDEDPVIKSLSDYERARIYQALGRKEEAKELYDKAHEESNDPETRGLSLLGMSNCVTNFKEKETLIERAINEEGYLDGYAYLGALYFNEKQHDEAERILKEGISKGVVLCVAMLSWMYMHIYSESSSEFHIRLWQMAALAESSGIANWQDEPFRQFNQQFLAKTVDGKTVNYMSVMEPLRKAVDLIFREKRAEETV